jgi:uncharacterized protein YdhG (YjbR/CyaY superfamily)
MSAPNIDSYLEAVAAEKRLALENLRATLHSLVDNLEECISYGLPAFRWNGKVLVGFGAAARHCAFYPWSSNIVHRFPEELAGYSTSKGAIRFQPDHPLPTSLLRKLVEARMEEVSAPGYGRRP